MNKKFAFISVGVIVLTTVVLVFKLRPQLSGEIDRILSSKTITTQSRIEGKTLEWRNKKALENILSELAIFEEGARDIKTQEIYEIDDINIIYTPELQTTFTNRTIDNEVLSGGSYAIEGQKLTISIYVNESLAPEGDFDTVFNQKMIELLVMLSPTTTSRTVDLGTSTTLEERMNYFYNILEENFDPYDKTKSYPIKII